MTRKPHLIFFSAALCAFIASLAMSGADHVLDIQLHDTYYVFPSTHLLLLIGVFLLVIAVIYLSASIILYSNWMTQAHTVLALLSIVSLIFGLEASANFHIEAIRSSNYENLSNYSRLATITFCAILIFLFSQTILIVNVCVGIISNRRKS
jgi:heme/copper-type cytochrome/quinol oxidase subunit 1